MYVGEMMLGRLKYMQSGSSFSEPSSSESDISVENARYYQISAELIQGKVYITF
jgi:hypothetical protein